MNDHGRAAQRRRVWLAAGCVFALALLAYGTAVAGAFVFDDVHSIAANPAVHDLGNLGRFWTDPSTFSPGSGRMYRPALLTSFALNWAVSPTACSLKLGNVLLHGAVAALLFGWTWRLSRRLRASALVAALFAVHPLASEAINLVSARSEVLSTAGLLVVLHAHVSWQRGRGRWLALAGMVAGTVLACGSKETGVVAPVVCALQAWWLRHGGVDRSGLRRAFAGVVPVVAVVVVYLLARKLLLGEVAVPLLARAGGDPLSGHGRTLLTQLATMGTLLPQCVLQMVAPVWLALDPIVHYRDSLLAPAVLAGWGTMGALTVWACWPGPSARLRRLGAALAWGTALPWIVVPLNMPLAEHRLYAPLVGCAAIVVAASPRLRELARRVVAPRAATVAPAMLHAAAAAAAFAEDGARASPARRRALVGRWTAPALAGAVLLLGAFTSGARSLLYRDETLLWRVELARHPQSFRAWWGLGAATLRGGDAVAALPALARAHELYPRHLDALRNYVECLVSLPDSEAQPERSLAIAARLCDEMPDDPWGRTLHAQANLQAGRVRAERAAFERAEALALSCLAIAPPKGYVYRLAAEARRGLGDLDGALAHLDTSIARGLGSIEVRLARAAVLRELGRARDAQRELLVAQREHPGHPAVMQALQQLAAPPR